MCGEHHCYLLTSHIVWQMDSIINGAGQDVIEVSDIGNVAANFSRGLHNLVQGD